MADELARYRLSDHLVGLVERAGLAAGRLSTVSPAALEEQAHRSVRAQARSSARLDGSPLSDETADRVDRDGLAGAVDDAGVAEATASGQGWAQALRLGQLPSQSLAAREYANLLACRDLEGEQAATFFDQPLDSLVRLHGAICEGLVEPGLTGRIRRTERAIHDGAQGQMLWVAPAPDLLPGLVDRLLDWVGDASAARPTLVVAAVVHGRLLEWQPFEAANGRLARSAARVIRRARGLDPHGVAVPELLWQESTLAYHREIAATKRRRGDLSVWIERAVHAEALALERAANDVAGATPVTVSARAEAFLADLPARAPVTAKDYAARTGVGRERARAELAAASRAGLIEEDAGVAGMRYRVPRPAGGPAARA